MNATEDRAKSIFLSAAEIAAAEDRRAFLEAECAGDASLRGEVEALLGHQQALGSFLESPPAGLDATVDRPLSERPGTVIGPYKLLQQIGEGGMGVVFMAEQTQPIQRTVALKIIKPGMDTRQVIARFEAERQALALMDHPSIARVIDAGGTDTGRPYFVMELVKGAPITEYCDAQHLSVGARLELMAAVCQAVQHAHQKGIIHRDIKPSNVLVADYEGKPVPKIIDFGVAKATAQRLTERTMFTEYGQLIGTFEYMSPEQARFNQVDVDTRSDIYSLGVLLYEVLAGSTPLQKERLRSAAFDEVLRIICEEEPQRPSTRLTSSEYLPSIAANRSLEPKKLTGLVSGELDWIVMKCLEKDRNRRYETAGALADDFNRYLDDQPVEARPVTQVYRLKKFVRRNSASVLAATAIVGALVAGLVLASVGFVRARHEAQIAEAEAAKATAISDLLQNALHSADPEQSKGAGYTVRELLQDISSNMGDRFSQQPEVEIELRNTIGHAYRRLGTPAPAVPHFKSAMELARRVYGPDDTKFANVLVGYAQNLVEQNRNHEAENVLEEAIQIYRRAGNPGREIVKALWTYEILLNSLSRFADAERVAQEAIAVCETNQTECPELPSVLHKLSDIKINQKDYAAAERVATRAVEIHRQLNGNQNVETALGLTALGHALAANRKYPDAEAAYREALTIFRRHFDGNHKSIKYAYSGLLKALDAQGKNAELETLKWEHDQRINSGYGEKLSFANLELCEHLADAGRVDQSIDGFRAALANNELAVNELPTKKWPRELARQICINIATCLPDRALDDPEQAEHSRQLFRQAFDHCSRVSADDDPNRVALTECYWKLITLLAYNPSWAAEVDEVERRFSASLADYQSGGSLGRFGHNARILVLSWPTTGERAALKEKLLQDALHVFEKLSLEYPDQSIHWHFLSHTQCEMALLYMRTGRPQEAENAFRRAVKLANEHAKLLDAKPINNEERASIYLWFAWFFVCSDRPTEPELPDLFRMASVILAKDAQMPEAFAWWLFGMASAKDNPQTTLTVAQQAVDSVPDDWRYWNTLGAVQYRAGEFQNAITSLEKSIELRKTEDEWEWLFLAMSHWQLGHKAEARAWYDKDVARLNEHKAQSERLIDFRVEAAKLLGLPEPPSPQP